MSLKLALGSIALTLVFCSCETKPSVSTSASKTEKRTTASATCVKGVPIAKVATFNILNKNVAGAKSYPPWSDRAPLIAAWVREQNLDIMATQEGVTDMIKDLQRELPGYRAVGRARSRDPVVGEHSSIFIRESRYGILKSGDFWLSQNPDVPESKGWDASMTRMCTWAELQDKLRLKKLFVFNCHFDHAGAQAQEESVNLVVEKARNLAQSEDVAIFGDFNMTDDNESLLPMKMRFADSKDRHRNLPSASEKSFPGGTIDHVFLSASLTSCRYEVARVLTKSAQALSDHRPVVVEFQ